MQTINSLNLYFLISATLLTLAALAWLLYPLLKRSNSTANISRRALNTALYRDQLAELERDRTDGNLAAADYDQATAELQHRLLQDAAVADAIPDAARPAKRTAFALTILLPLGAALLYLWLGHPAAINPPTAQQQITSAQIDDMVAKLAARMEENPNDLKGWIMLARSYKALHRFDEAVNAFERSISLGGGENPDLLADYADMLAMRAGGNLEGKPLELVKRALALDPKNIMALALAGAAAYNRQDLVETTRYWESLLKILPPDSEDAKSLTATLAKIREKGGSAGSLTR